MVDQGSNGVIRVTIVGPAEEQTEAMGDVVQLKDGSYKIQARDNVGSFVHICDRPHVDVYLGGGLVRHDFDVSVRVVLVASGPIASSLVSQVSGAVGFAGSIAGVSGRPGMLNVEFTQSGIYASSQAALGGTLFMATPVSNPHGG